MPLSCIVLFLEPRILTPTSVIPMCISILGIFPAFTPAPSHGQHVAPSLVWTWWYAVLPR